MPARSTAVALRLARRAVVPVVALATAVLAIAGVLAPAASARTTRLPAAGIRMLEQTRTGAWIKGWAVDPVTTAATSVQLTVDSTVVATVRADQNVKGRPGHGFTAVLPLTSGPHTVCAVPLAVAAGGQHGAPACQAVDWAYSPLGWFASLTRTATGVTLAGWAFDPDTYAATSIAYTVDGTTGISGTATADVWRADVGTAFPRFGHLHGFAVDVPADTGEHTVCVTATNVGGGTDTPLGCKTITAVAPLPPSAPQHVVAAATSTGGALLTWQAPASDGGAPVTQYVVTSSPGTSTVAVPAGTLTTTIPGLVANTPYTFSVVADNSAGASPAGVSNPLTITVGPPPQRTPAPVSTSRYIRNIRGASATDLATMRNEGYADAQANPSGHRYLILLDIGGQDEYDGGVVLSATTRFVSYANLEKDLQAYVDGYHSGQRPNAPVVIAAGTNNDMDVSASAGASWATHVVGPLRRHAQPYAGMRIAGADDMEPGFSATYAQTSAWLGGFLDATAAPFVFNGSADGCAWTVTNAHCNNGWWMSGLYHLAAGAAPTRIINLPQIYNTTMAAQWKYISLTGIGAGRPRIAFGGPLTEWTACSQAGGCGSLTGHTAWTTLWNDLQSDPRLAVGSLPYSTDLRIDS